MLPSPTIPSPESTPRRPRIGPRAGVLWTLLGLLLFELVLRTAGYPNQIATIADPDLGWVQLPNQDLVVDGTRIRINADGFRDVDWAPRGDEDALRVALLGDSVPYGTGIDAEHRLTESLARHLEREPLWTRVVVRNFATPGYSFEQMRALYERTVLTWKPDVVFVALNDASHRPLVVPRRGGWVRRLLIRTATYQWWLTVSNFEFRQPVEDADETRRARQTVESFQQEPFAEANLGAWTAVVEGLVQLQAHQAQHGGRLVVLCLPRIRHIANPRLPYVGTYLAERLESAGLARVDPLPMFRATMGPLIAKLRAAGLDGRTIWTHEPPVVRSWPPELELFAQRTNLFQFEDPDHWTSLAHELAGRALAEELRVGR